MSIARQIEQLQDYPQSATEEFRKQLERANAARQRLDGTVPQGQGIDRSGELVPVLRPRIVRTLADD